jgi:hypothetical protein
MSTPSPPVPPSAEGADVSTSSSTADPGVAVDVDNLLILQQPSMEPVNVCSNWNFGERLEVSQPTIFSVNTKQRLNDFNSVKTVVLKSTMIVILQDALFVLKFPALIPEGPNPTVSFSGEGTVEWQNPCAADSAMALSTDLLAASGIIFRAHDMDMFRSVYLTGAQLATLSMRIRGAVNFSGASPDSAVIRDKFVNAVRSKTFSFMCGSGTSHSICREAPTWSRFIDEYARIVKLLTDETEDWMQAILREPSLTARADLICRHVNRYATGTSNL